MNKLNLLLVLSFIVSISIAQVPAKIKKNKSYTSQSGLMLTVFEINKNAPKADSGDFISVHYVGKLADGTEFDASYNRQQPIAFTLGVGKVIKGWDEGLQYLHVGDSASFVIPPEIGYGARDKGNIPPNSTLYFTVKVVDLKQAVKPYDVSKLDTVKLDSGLSYIIVAKGKGDGIQVGEKAFLQYSGYFTDGKKFDSSHDNGGKSFDFILGRHRVIDGWELGLIGMKEGEKRRLNVPYALAYGENGRQPIPPKSDLVFDIEMEKIERIDYPQFDLAGKDTITLPSGLKYIVALATDGEKVLPHDDVIIQYVGIFLDGKIFDSSYDRGDSLIFEVAGQKVIRGLDEGMLLMKKGEKIRFIVPYQLAYGEDGRPPIIPAKSNLIFDVYLQNIVKAKQSF